jgi:hypothetical protein
MYRADNYVQIQQLTSKVTKAIHTFRFLSEKVIVVANVAHKSLELYTLPEQHGATGGTTMTMVARLHLPNTDCYVYSMTFCSSPAKNGMPRNNVAVFTKPFTNSPDNIIYCCMGVNNTQESGHVSLIVHSSTLLRYATSQDLKFIRWNEWGTMARCVDARQSHAANFSGQRWRRWNEIWDFNQYRVKRLGMDFSAETETARISVITKGSTIKALDNHVSFCSGTLPYVRIVQK